MLLITDFQTFPDNTVLGPQVSLGSVQLRDLGGTNPSFVNRTGGQKGLQVHNNGIDVIFGGPAEWARFTVGQFKTAYTIKAYGGSGQIVAELSIDTVNTFLQHALAGNEPIFTVRFEGGGNELVIETIEAFLI